jgi:hypothetical protein
MGALPASFAPLAPRPAAHKSSPLEISKPNVLIGIRRKRQKLHFLENFSPLNIILIYKNRKEAGSREVAEEV